MPQLRQPPPHLIEIAIEATSRADRARLLAALPSRVERHPGCLFEHDPQTGQTILGGLDEAGLDSLVSHLRSVCAIRLGAPQIAYRETIAHRVEVDYTLKTQTQGRGRFARVKLVMEPGDRLAYTSKIVGGAIPDEFLAGVETGVIAALAAGVHIGARVMNVAVTLIDGAWHDQDSSAESFETAGRDACREGLSSGGPTLLEPVMRVEVAAAADYEGAIIGDLRSRRGRIAAARADAPHVVVEAEVPLANLLGYAVDLHALTRGTGRVVSTFYAFEPVDPSDPPAFPGAAAVRIA